MKKFYVTKESKEAGKANTTTPNSAESSEAQNVFTDMASTSATQIFNEENHFITPGIYHPDLRNKDDNVTEYDITKIEMKTSDAKHRKDISFDKNSSNKNLHKRNPSAISKQNEIEVVNKKMTQKTEKKLCNGCSKEYMDYVYKNNILNLKAKDSSSPERTILNHNNDKHEVTCPQYDLRENEILEMKDRKFKNDLFYTWDSMSLNYNDDFAAKKVINSKEEVHLEYSKEPEIEASHLLAANALATDTSPSKNEKNISMKTYLNNGEENRFQTISNSLNDIHIKIGNQEDTENNNILSSGYRNKKENILFKMCSVPLVHFLCLICLGSIITLIYLFRHMIIFPFQIAMGCSLILFFFIAVTSIIAFRKTMTFTKFISICLYCLYGAGCFVIFLFVVNYSFHYFKIAALNAYN